MLKLTKSLILPVLGATVIGGGILGVTVVNAGSTSGPGTIISKIAQKFGLKEADVKAVFDEARADRQAQMETKYEARLDQLVKDGKITEAQKQLIIGKHKELVTTRQSMMQSLQNLTPQERRDKMQQEKTDLENWAKQNGIPTQYVFLMGFGRGAGGKGFGMKGGWNK